MTYWIILFTYLAFVYGVTNDIVNMMGPFDIFDKIRNLGWKIHKSLGELLECPVCTSTWVGFIVSALLLCFDKTWLTPTSFLYYGTLPNWLIVFIDGVSVSGLVWLIHVIEEKLEKE